MSSDFVNSIFTSVAGKYDCMNDIMSFGLHRFWKDALVDSVTFQAGSKALDNASGTGDIAFKIFKKCSDINITLCDKNIDMLTKAKNRFIDSNILNASFICAAAENLPFKNDFFDYYLISFGIRNVNDISASLSEAHRVLIPGGRFLCLEFGHVRNSCVSILYDLYSFKIIPFIGEKIAKNRDAYQYLVDSIRKFPFKEEFIIMMHSAGFKQITCIDMSFGIVNIYSAIK